MSTMVLGNFIKEDEIGTPTSTSDSILIKEEIICSSDESINTQSSLSNSFTDQSEEKTEGTESKMLVDMSADDNLASAIPSSHEEATVTNGKNCIEVLSSSKDDDIVPEEIKALKNKLHRVLKKRDQYKRRVESLTNGIIALRGTKLILERKIIGAKLSWDIKHNRRLNK